MDLWGFDLCSSSRCARAASGRRWTRCFYPICVWKSCDQKSTGGKHLIFPHEPWHFLGVPDMASEANSGVARGHGTMGPLVLHQLIASLKKGWTWYNPANVMVNCIVHIFLEGCCILTSIHATVRNSNEFIASWSLTQILMRKNIHHNLWVP